jgi:acyl carrier protein
VNEVSDRLTRCFQAVFPAMTPAEVEAATTESVSTWDSLATVTLVNVIEEEFQLQIDPEQYNEVVSFATAEALVRRSLG